MNQVLLAGVFMFASTMGVLSQEAVSDAFLLQLRDRTKSLALGPDELADTYLFAKSYGAFIGAPVDSVDYEDFRNFNSDYLEDIVERAVSDGMIPDRSKSQLNQQIEAAKAAGLPFADLPPEMLAERMTISGAIMLAAGARPRPDEEFCWWPFCAASPRFQFDGAAVSSEAAASMITGN